MSRNGTKQRRANAHAWSTGQNCHAEPENSGNPNSELFVQLVRLFTSQQMLTIQHILMWLILIAKVMTKLDVKLSKGQERKHAALLLRCKAEAQAKKIEVPMKTPNSRSGTSLESRRRT